MMRPFSPGDTLDNHAAPMGEVLQQLQTQLAEYSALKEQMAGEATGIHTVLPPDPYSSISMDITASADSNNTSLSTSSSFLHLDTPRSFDMRSPQ